MLWKQWEPYYKNILRDMDIEEKNDLKAALFYLNLVKKIDSVEEIINKSITETKRRLKNKNVLIFGAGPNLLNHLELLKEILPSNNSSIISADGATRALLEYDLIPNIVVTDYDGHMDSIINAGNHDSIVYLHAHGDNIVSVKKWFLKASQLPYWIPTIQTEPHFPFLFNFGGFTDGDRALSLALEFAKPCKVVLFGFEFGEIIGKYSKPHFTTDIKANKFKKMKLDFAEKFIKDLGYKWYKEHEIVIYSEDIKLESIF
ncbi:MAG: 6-hydroxymethylpterin diphosphokinase MptE-like protein [Candidatus Hodarchaeales archaeon]|jgi:uncharacterized Rossmann fold enzyme